MIQRYLLIPTSGLSRRDLLPLLYRPLLKVQHAQMPRMCIYICIECNTLKKNELLLVFCVLFPPLKNSDRCCQCSRMCLCGTATCVVGSIKRWVESLWAKYAKKHQCSVCSNCVVQRIIKMALSDSSGDQTCLWHQLSYNLLSGRKKKCWHKICILFIIF